mmetsp:Transcript_5095/g.11323  ORF Transcript_5095/g.11323 Transcript_5095/m.11323 type:complete len:1103 (+) Transcript_5095:167-3475(+)
MKFELRSSSTKRGRNGNGNSTGGATSKSTSKNTSKSNKSGTRPISNGNGSNKNNSNNDNNQVLYRMSSYDNNSTIIASNPITSATNSTTTSTTTSTTSNNPSTNVIYYNDNDEYKDDDVLKIVSAVKQGLRKSKAKGSRSNSNSTLKKPPASPPKPSGARPTASSLPKTAASSPPKTAPRNEQPLVQRERRQRTASAAAVGSAVVGLPVVRGVAPSTNTNTIYNTHTRQQQQQQAAAAATAVVSDDDDTYINNEDDYNNNDEHQQNKLQHWSRAQNAGIHGFLHRMMFDESAESASVIENYNNYTDEDEDDDESYGSSDSNSNTNTGGESSGDGTSVSSSSSYSRDSEAKGNHRGRGDRIRDRDRDHHGLDPREKRRRQRRREKQNQKQNSGETRRTKSRGKTKGRDKRKTKNKSKDTKEASRRNTNNDDSGTVDSFEESFLGTSAMVSLELEDTFDNSFLTGHGSSFVMDNNAFNNNNANDTSNDTSNFTYTSTGTFGNTTATSINPSHNTSMTSNSNYSAGSSFFDVRDKDVANANANATKAGLEVVAQLLSLDTNKNANHPEIILDAAAIASAPMTLQQARKVATPIAEALAKSTLLKKIQFGGPWNSHNYTNTANGHNANAALNANTLAARKEILLVLFNDGLRHNTSVHTIVLRDNPCFDQYAGSVFGNMLRVQGRIRRLEVLNCRFSATSRSSRSTSTLTSSWSSGWNCLLMGLQHSRSVKALSLENIAGFSCNDLNGISLTVKYLELESVRLVGVNLLHQHQQQQTNNSNNDDHERERRESLAVFFKALQDAQSVKELDLSRNLLGGGGHSLYLLSRCLSGERVEPYGGNTTTANATSNGTNAANTNTTTTTTLLLPIAATTTPSPPSKLHIERLSLVDCGITRASDIKMLTRALGGDSKSSGGSSCTATTAGAGGNKSGATTTSSLDLSGNQFGNAGAKVLLEWIKAHPGTKKLGMLSCNVGTKYLKSVSDQLRYNNSFLQTIGLSSNVSLAILDSVSTMEHVFGGVGSGGGGNPATPTTTTTTTTTTNTNTKASYGNSNDSTSTAPMLASTETESACSNSVATTAPYYSSSNANANNPSTLSVYNRVTSCSRR